MVGGLEHVFIFSYLGNFIIPTDEFIFFRGVGMPPTRYIWKSMGLSLCSISLFLLEGKWAQNGWMGPIRQHAFSPTCHGVWSVYFYESAVWRSHLDHEFQKGLTLKIRGVGPSGPKMVSHGSHLMTGPKQHRWHHRQVSSPDGGARRFGCGAGVGTRALRAEAADPQSQGTEMGRVLEWGDWILRERERKQKTCLNMLNHMSFGT